MSLFLVIVPLAFWTSKSHDVAVDIIAKKKWYFRKKKTDKAISREEKCKDNEKKNCKHMLDDF